MRKTNQQTRGRIIESVIRGDSFRKIAKRFNMGHGTVSKIWREHASVVAPSASKKSGRPRTIPTRLARKIARDFNCGISKSPNDVAVGLRNSSMVEVGERTIRRTLGRRGMAAYTKKKKPSLTDAHKRQRVEWAKRVRNWTRENWRKVLFSDETKMNVCGSDGIRYTWKKRGAVDREHNIEKTRRFGGGSVMVWGVFGFSGVGNACRIEHGLDANLYLEILNEDLLGSLPWCLADEEGWMFQQDNASAHKARKVMDWFQENGIRILDFPPNSPDLNPIENLWSIVKRKVHQRGPHVSRQAVWEVFEEEWERIDPALCGKLIDSMPERIRLVIKSKGNPIKY